MAAPPADKVVSYTVTIMPPQVSAIMGVNANAQFPYCDHIPPTNATNPTATSLDGQTGDWIYFVLKSNGKTIGPQIGNFTVQEMITNVIALGQPRPDLSTPWRPNNPKSPNPNDQGPDNNFVLRQLNDGTNNFAICDFKCATPPNGPNGFYPTGVILTYTQQNQIVWADQAGNMVSQDLGTQNWTLMGYNNPNEWSISYQNGP